MLATIKCGIIFLTPSQVPLQSLGKSRFLNNSIRAPAFTPNLSGCSPDGYNEFKNSTGLFTTSEGTRTVALD